MSGTRLRGRGAPGGPPDSSSPATGLTGRGERPPRAPRPPRAQDSSAAAAAAASAGRAPLTSVGAHVSLQVEGVIEALPAVSAEVPLDVVVTLHVAIQHALVREGLLADVAGEEVSTGSVP